MGKVLSSGCFGSKASRSCREIGLFGSYTEVQAIPQESGNTKIAAPSTKVLKIDVIFKAKTDDETFIFECCRRSLGVGSVFKWRQRYTREVLLFASKKTRSWDERGHPSSW
eukprot:GHVS01001623.1.p2 GENE.GHVS01001623.1~~GHVS01001623.1.p2  ORF type:complete len:111 (+),score=11.56 GHVS01001623.1:405-737(+)